MPFLAKKSHDVQSSDQMIRRAATPLDQHTDTQMALLKGVLEVMRQPKSSDAFEILKSRFADRAMAIHMETVKQLKSEPAA